MAQSAGGIAITGTGAGAPVGAALIATAPVTGTTAAVGASLYYNDKVVDKAVEEFAEPVIATVIDTTVSFGGVAIETVSTGTDWVGNQFNQMSESICDRF